jgi:hypothetical protein
MGDRDLDLTDEIFALATRRRYTVSGFEDEEFALWPGAVAVPQDRVRLLEAATRPPIDLEDDPTDDLLVFKPVIPRAVWYTFGYPSPGAKRAGSRAVYNSVYDDILERIIGDGGKPRGSSARWLSDQVPTIKARKDALLEVLRWHELRLRQVLEWYGRVIAVWAYEVGLSKPELSVSEEATLRSEVSSLWRLADPDANSADTERAFAHDLRSQHVADAVRVSTRRGVEWYTPLARPLLRIVMRLEAERIAYDEALVAAFTGSAPRTWDQIIQPNIIPHKDGRSVHADNRDWVIEWYTSHRDKYTSNNACYNALIVAYHDMFGDTHGDISSDTIRRYIEARY